MDRIRKELQWNNIDDLVTFHFFYSEFSPHVHDHYEIMLITQGEAEHVFNDQVYKTSIHDAWLVTPKDKHSLVPNNKCHHLNLALSPEAIKLFCNVIDQTFFSTLQNATAPTKITLTQESHNRVISLIHKYQALNIEEITKKNGILNCVALHLIEEFYLNLPSRTKQLPAWLTEFLKTLSSPESLAQKPTQVYQTVPYSYSNFERLFKKYLGISFLTYFNLLKMNYAKELLKTTELPIITISNKIGISSLSHFYHVFKEQNGMSPSKYRKQFKLK